MIIEALVRIELKSDGTWQIVGLKALTETKLPEEPHQPRSMLKHFSRVDEHFRNRERIRKKRAREKSRVPHHCSICGKAHHNKVTHPFHNL